MNSFEIIKQGSGKKEDVFIVLFHIMNNDYFQVANKVTGTMSLLSASEIRREYNFLRLS